MKYLIAFAVIGAVGLSIQTTNAQLLFSEGFNYTSGASLSGKVNPSSSVAWNGGSTVMTIGSSQLTYPALSELPGLDLILASGSGSSHTAVNTYSAVTSGSIYFSFLLDATTLPTAANYLMALNPGTIAPGGGSDALSTYVINSGSGYEVGVRTPGGAATYESTVLSANTTYFIVEELTLGSAPVASLYLDPTPGAAQPGSPSATVTGSTAVSSVADIGFKSQTAATPGTEDFGNLLIGDTWSDVTPSPEPSVLALAGAGLGLLGLVRFRRRS